MTSKQQLKKAINEELNSRISAESEKNQEKTGAGNSGRKDPGKDKVE